MKDYWEKMIIHTRQLSVKRTHVSGSLDLLNYDGEYNTKRLRDQGFNEDEVRLRTGATYYIHALTLFLISLRKENLPERLLERGRRFVILKKRRWIWITRITRITRIILIMSGR
jgi:hypothetical protein